MSLSILIESISLFSYIFLFIHECVIDATLVSAPLCCSIGFALFASYVWIRFELNCDIYDSIDANEESATDRHKAQPSRCTYVR